MQDHGIKSHENAHLQTSLFLFGFGWHSPTYSSLHLELGSRCRAHIWILRTPKMRAFGAPNAFLIISPFVLYVEDFFLPTHKFQILIRKVHSDIISLRS